MSTAARTPADPLAEPFYVEVKDRWSVCPATFKTADQAMQYARTQVRTAMRVTVYHPQE